VKPESINNTYHGLLGLDRLPRGIKTFNVIICLIIVTYASITGIFHLNGLLLPTSTPSIYYWIAILSPSCIATGWLRITGLKWRMALLFFIFAWLAFWGAMFVYGLVGLMYMDP
jgi:hypothetical protein